MTDDKKIENNKTLTDIICPEILELKASMNWRQMSSNDKKKKGFIYNKVLKQQWAVDDNLNWVCEYNALNEIQKRMLLKKELINSYNDLEENDRMLFNEYLNIERNNTKWHTLSQENKRVIFKTLFKFF